jgi:hypothetical protein
LFAGAAFSSSDILNGTHEVSAPKQLCCSHQTSDEDSNGWFAKAFMKWYKAILLTLVIFVLMLVAVQIDERGGHSLALLVSGVSAVWVAARSSSFGWGLFVMFLWPVAFPLFFIAKYQPAADDVTRTAP